MSAVIVFISNQSLLKVTKVAINNNIISVEWLKILRYYIQILKTDPVKNVTKVEAYVVVGIDSLRRNSGGFAKVIPPEQNKRTYAIRFYLDLIILVFFY